MASSVAPCKWTVAAALPYAYASLKKAVWAAWQSCHLGNHSYAHHVWNLCSTGVVVVVVVVVSYASDDRRASIEQPRILRQPKPKRPLAKSPRITRINIAVNLKYTGKYRWFLMSHKKIY